LKAVVATPTPSPVRVLPSIATSPAAMVMPAADAPVTVSFSMVMFWSGPPAVKGG